MADTKISWAEKVWNPVTGCSKVSAGCAHCYAERMAKRLQGRAGYPKINPFDVTLHADKLDEPLKWKSPQRIFVCSMGDLFHEKVPFWFIDEVFAVILEAVQHTFLILTKRPERMREYFDKFRQEYLPISNVWMGTSVEDQRAADKRIPHLLKVPAVVRFLSCEPLLGPLELDEIPGALLSVKKDQDENFLVDKGLDWIICVGESGPGARLMNDEWVRDLDFQCQAGNIPFFFKQWGEWIPNEQISPELARKLNFCNLNFENHSNGKTYWRLGKKLAGNELDGCICQNYPAL